MLFNSLEFLLLFLPLVLAVARGLRGRALLAWLSLVSFVFYAFAGHVWFLVPMAVTTVLDFWVGRRLPSSRGARKRAWLLLSLVGNLGLLAYFKYSGLLLRSGQSLLHQLGVETHLHAFEVILPAGISFYTFQTMSYVIDIYRGDAHPEKSFFAYIAFVAFFPHLVAGPLTRHNQLIPQLDKVAQRGVRPDFTGAVLLFSIGLCKKVLLADRLGSWADPIIDHIGEAGLASAWLAMLGYALQIYFDFSGYSDMAVGLGRLFNIELPQNFKSPYKALDPSDFWRRWHVTLSQWLRDYLYIGLGGNRAGPRRTQVNLMITMVLGGLWHGASWTFAVWGLYHGVLLVLYHRFAVPWDRLPRLARRILMFLLVCLGWLFFRAPTLAAAGSWGAALLGLHGVGATIGLGKLASWVVVGLGICNLAENGFELDLPRLSGWRSAALAVGTAASVVLMNYSSKFLYFQF